MKENRLRKAPPELRYLQARSVRATFGSNQAYVFELMYDALKAWWIVFRSLTKVSDRFIKLAVLAFYYRVAVSRKHRIVLYITAALVIGYCMSHNIVSGTLRHASRPKVRAIKLMRPHR